MSGRSSGRLGRSGSEVKRGEKMEEVKEGVGDGVAEGVAD